MPNQTPAMTLPKNVAELQGENVVFELECIDRMYLNLYVPQLASAPGVAAYFRGYKGHRFASTKEAVAMSEGFRRQVLDFAERKATPIIRFEKGMRKDDVMHKRLRKFKAREGVVFIGIAQEKARVPRTIRKRFGEGRLRVGMHRPNVSEPLCAAVGERTGRGSLFPRLQGPPVRFDQGGGGHERGVSPAGARLRRAKGNPDHPV